jgi:hypothetical protein
MLTITKIDYATAKPNSKKQNPMQNNSNNKVKISKKL